MLKHLIPIAAAAAVVATLGCASTAGNRARDLEPSSAAEPPSTDPLLESLRSPPAPAPSAAPAPAHSAPAAPASSPAAARAATADKGEFDNKPLPTLPSDPPPPPNSEDAGDDNWARDQRNTKLRDKDRDKVKHSDPEDDAWGRE